MSPTILPSGDGAVLVEVAGGSDAVLRIAHAVRAATIPGVVDVVPGAATVLVIADSRVADPRSLRASVARAVEPEAIRDALPGGRETQHHVLPVVYSGPDLAEVASLLGMSREQVVALHAASSWRVAFLGFAPGFGYLVTDHESLTVPRRSSPRVRVPAGAVGLAGSYSGVYPAPGPGGWRVIGHCDVPLWDADGGALLAAGDLVRFTIA